MKRDKMKILIFALLMNGFLSMEYNIKREKPIIISAPDFFCLPGIDNTNDFASSCPKNIHESTMYNSVLMDTEGIFTVKLKNVRISHLTPFGSKNKNASFRLQFMLLPISAVADAISTKCCYEDFSSKVKDELSMQKLNSQKSFKEITSKISKNLPAECKATINYKGTSDEPKLETSFNYRIGMQRIAKKDGHVSPPIRMFLGEREGENKGFDIIFTVKSFSKKAVPHVILVSNCAAEADVGVELNVQNKSASINEDIVSFEIDSIEMGHASKFGEMPLSMMGIIPFYAILVFCYAFLAAFWHIRSRNKYILQLQYIIKTIVNMQLIFCSLAFSYYVHLNRQSVDVKILYSGTAAALIDFNFWSIIVALGHFCTILVCQFAVTLAADGTWLIQNNVRSSTRRALYILCAAWIIFFVMYGFVNLKIRRCYFIFGGLVWILYILNLSFKSLNHIKSLIEGNSNDSVIAAGGVLVAKKSLFRKLVIAISGYPVVFLITLVWKDMVSIF